MKNVFIVLCVVFVIALCVGCDRRASNDTTVNEMDRVEALIQKADMPAYLEAAFLNAVKESRPRVKVVNGDFTLCSYLRADTSISGFIDLPIGTGVKYWEIEDSVNVRLGADLYWQIVSIDDGRAIGFRVDAETGPGEFILILFLAIIGILVIVVFICGIVKMLD